MSNHRADDHRPAHAHSPGRGELAWLRGGLFFSAFRAPDDRIAVSLYVAMFHRMPSLPVLKVCSTPLLGAAFGSSCSGLWAALYKRVRGHEGMGMGDVR